ncbi:MAG TPA: FAD-binding oxidoreductase [Candidatus Limnocylindria bacterium]|nr:FAD-binding oxidoreductase [Candidatus Limnocylindria bacterium]
MTLSTSALQDLFAELRDRISGRVIEPGDPGYDEAREVMYAGHDRRPAAIVRVASVEDVQAVVNLARELDVELAIRSGGHSAKGDSTTEGGLVLDLRDLRSIEIDPAAKTAWAETGLTAGEVSVAANEHGLIVGFGDTGSVGIGGITTGGGVGYLVRKHGLTIDNLLAADVVTADGQLVRADADTNPDLFWAIRGGGGNFGVATRFQYRLVDLPAIVGGMMILPASAEIVERYVALADEAPLELSSIGNVMTCPPMPFVDEVWHGRIVIMSLLCFAGGAEDGQEAIQPFRDLAKLAGLDAPIADMTKPMQYPELFPPEDPDYHPLAVSMNLLMDDFERKDAETIMDRLESSDAPLRVAQIRVMGGAMAEVPVDATAFAHRKRRIMVNVASFYEGEADKDRREAWVQELTDALRGDDHGAYVNFVGSEGDERVHEIYPGDTYRRLAEVKRRWDPGNLFRLNQNIPPA